MPTAGSTYECRASFNSPILNGDAPFSASPAQGTLCSNELRKENVLARVRAGLLEGQTLKDKQDLILWTQEGAFQARGSLPKSTGRKHGRQWDLTGWAVLKLGGWGQVAGGLGRRLRSGEGLKGRETSVPECGKAWGWDTWEAGAPVGDVWSCPRLERGQQVGSGWKRTKKGTGWWLTRRRPLQRPSPPSRG